MPCNVPHMTNHTTPTERFAAQRAAQPARTKFVPVSSIDRTIHANLVRDFGADADLNEVTLAEIEDSIIIALMDAGRGGVEECRENAERIAARINGMVL